jgi:hypothetical protein
MTAAISPCPFCGVALPLARGYFTHPKSDCYMSELKVSEHSERDIAAWNKRAAAPADMPARRRALVHDLMMRPYPNPEHVQAALVAGFGSAFTTADREALLTTARALGRLSNQEVGQIFSHWDTAPVPVGPALAKGQAADYADDGCDDAWQAMRAAAARRATSLYEQRIAPIVAENEQRAREGRGLIGLPGRTRDEYEFDNRAQCWCERCRPNTVGYMRMVLCPTCGNKRCPRASWHGYKCTGSNDVGQVGEPE